jgi:hypothetical protein
MKADSFCQKLVHYEIWMLLKPAMYSIFDTVCVDEIQGQMSCTYGVYVLFFPSLNTHWAGSYLKKFCDVSTFFKLTQFVLLKTQIL